MAGVFDIELHDADTVNNRDDSDDDTIEVEEVIFLSLYFIGSMWSLDMNSLIVLSLSV